MKPKQLTWQVKIEDEASRIFSSKQLTNEDREIIHQWAKEVAAHGPQVLLEKPEIWADHPLVGKWEGHRASSFSYQGRIIYRIEDQVVTVIVVRISPDHDYKR
jgi:mRNA-degrading endonuclease YafQ of YafQ-DinJ toxin-antitoxin module